MSGVPIEGGRFLVTGGAGFVGSHMVTSLLDAGASAVTVLDLSRRGDAYEAHDARVEWVIGDMRDRSLVARAVAGCNGAFHMATSALGACIEDPVTCAQVNIAATLDLMEVGIPAGVRKVVFSSASSVYGETDEPTDESFPLRPSNLYGQSKVTAEMLLQWGGDVGGLEWVALRYMNVYGPRQVGGLIPAVIARIRAGDAPAVGGDGAARFDFVHVSDVVAANIAAMSSGASGVALNIGSGESASVLEIVHKLIALSGSDVEPVVPGGDSGPGRRGSIEAARSALGWEPRVGLGDGLAGLVGGEG